MNNRHPVQVIAVTGGKGGVGKTNVSVNLSLALADLGRRVALLDADLGLANVDILLGLTPKKNLSSVMSGECGLKEVMLDGPNGIKIFPASSGTQKMVALEPREHLGLIHAFSELDDELDLLIIDTAAGISDSVVSFVRAAQEAIVVVCDEPTSIADAYGLIKVLNREQGLCRFRILPNMVKSPQEAAQLFAKLTKVTDRFLDASLQLCGFIPYDDFLRKAVKRQRALYDLYPGAMASKAFQELAKKVIAWPVPQTPNGHLQFFVERLLTPALATG